MRVLHIALGMALALASASAPAGADDTCTTAPEGTACADDHDPCTTDRCVAGVCVHVDVPSRPTCEPLVDSYRRTLGLADLVGEVRAAIEAAPMPDLARAIVRDALDDTLADLGNASDVLAGRVPIPEPDAGRTIAQARARVAFGIARLTPGHVRAAMKALASPGVRVALGPPAADLARRVRFLYRSTNQFKRELRRLQRVSGALAR